MIRSAGELCGYSGGLWRKRWLLSHERETLERPIRLIAAQARTVARV